MTTMESSWAPDVVRHHHEKPYGFGTGAGTTTHHLNNHWSPAAGTQSSTSISASSMQRRGSLGKLIERSTSAPPSSSSTSESPYLRYSSRDFEDSSSLFGNDLLDQMSGNHDELNFTSASYGGHAHKSRDQHPVHRDLGISLLGTSSISSNSSRSTAPTSCDMSSSSTTTFLQSGFSMSPHIGPVSVTRPLSASDFGDYGLRAEIEGLIRSQSAAPSSYDAPVVVLGGGGGGANNGVGSLIQRSQSAAPTFSSYIGPPPGLLSGSSSSPSGATSRSSASPLRSPSATGLSVATTTTTTAGINHAALRPAPKTPMDLIQEDFPNDSPPHVYERSTPPPEQQRGGGGGVPTSTSITPRSAGGIGSALMKGQVAAVDYPYNAPEQHHQQFRYSQQPEFQQQQQLSPHYQEPYTIVQHGIPPQQPPRPQGGGDLLQQQQQHTFPAVYSSSSAALDHHNPGSIYTTHIHQPGVLQQQQTAAVLDPHHAQQHQQVYYSNSSRSAHPQRLVVHQQNGQTVYVNTAAPALSQPPHNPYGYTKIHYHHEPLPPPQHQQRVVTGPHHAYQQHPATTTNIYHHQQPVVLHGAGSEQQFMSIVPMPAADTGSTGYWQPSPDMSSLNPAAATLHDSHHPSSTPTGMMSSTGAVVNAPLLPGPPAAASTFTVARAGVNNGAGVAHHHQHMDLVPQQQQLHHSSPYGGGNAGTGGSSRGGREHNSNNKGRGRRGGGGGTCATRRVPDSKHGAAHGGSGGANPIYSKHSDAKGGSGGANPIMSTRLEEFRASKNRDWTMHEIVGYVVEFCQDQNGSRFIQQRLEMGDPSEQQVVAREILPSIRRLRNDVFGNYVVQKLLDFGSPQVKADIRDTLEGEMIQLSLQMYGCRVVQKAIEALDEQDVSRLLVEFHHNVLSCIHDQNGNHVIQKCIEVMNRRAKKARSNNSSGGEAQAAFLNDQIRFIIDDVLVNTVTLSCHPYGCRVLQRILEHCDEHRKEEVLNKIATCHKKLLDDQYGNYVIQHVLQFGRERDRDAILAIVAENGLLGLSRQKFASNVVEKLLKYGNSRHRCAIVREMLKKDTTLSVPGGVSSSDNANSFSSNHNVNSNYNYNIGSCSSVVLLMVRDAYANYVVQTALDVVPESEEKVLLLQELNAHSEELRQYTFAKHIVAKLGTMSAE